MKSRRNIIQAGGGVLAAMAANSASALTTAEKIILGAKNVPTGNYDVILIAGQSNAVGNGTGGMIHPTDDGNARVFQLTAGGPYPGRIMPALAPLLFAAFPTNTQISAVFPIPFANLYAANNLAVGRQVLLIPSAVASTGFTNNYWNPGNVGYNNAVTLSNIAMALPGSRFIGVLWLQGEYEAVVSMTAGDYARKMDAVVAGFRSQITGASNSWFILGQMQPQFITSVSPQEDGVNVAHIDSPNRNTKCAFWYGSTLNSALAIHYDTPSQRANGVAAYAALATLPNTTTLPGTVTGLAVASVGADYLSLTWTKPSSGCVATDYLVEYKVTGAGSWSTFTHTASAATSAILAGLLPSTSYDVQCTAVSTPGNGTPSSTVTQSTAAISTPATLANLVAWFDASNAGTITQSGGSVSQWTDVRGNGLILTQATTAKQPTVQAAAQNGKNTLRFTAANSQMMTITNPAFSINAAATGYTIVHVVRRGGPTGANSVFSIGSTGGNSHAALLYTDSKIYTAESVGYYITTSTFADTGYDLIAAVVPVSGAPSVYWNGVLQTVGTLSSSVNTLSYTQFGQMGGLYCNGEVAEAAMWNTQLNSTALTAMTSYFRTKWATP